MANLLNSEFFKLKKSVGFRVVSIVVFSYAVVQFLLCIVMLKLMPEYAEFMNGAYYVASAPGSINGGNVFSMLMGFIAASLITSDYKSRDIQCAIAQGYSRGKILATKTIVYMVSVLVLTFVLFLFTLCGITLINGYGREFGADEIVYILKVIGLSAFMSVCVYMTYIFFAMTFTSKAASITLNILVFTVANIGLSILELIVNNEKFSDVLGYLPFRSVSAICQRGADTKYILICMAVALVWGVVMYLGTWLIFRKRNMK